MSPAQGAPQAEEIPHTETVSGGIHRYREFQSEIASVEVLLKELESPHLNGVRLEEVVAAGQRLPDMAVLWEVATPDERREMVMILLMHGDSTMTW